MHEALLSLHSSPESLLSADRRFCSTADRSIRRSTPQALQPPPPSRLPRRATSSPLTSPSTTAAIESTSRAARHRGAPQGSTFYSVAAMNTQTQEALVTSHLRTPDPRDSSTLDRSQCQSVDLPPKQRGSVRKRRGGGGMASEASFRCFRTGPGATLAKAAGITRSAIASDEGDRSSVSGPGGPSSRNDTPLIIDYSSSPLTLAVNSANANNAIKNASSATSVDSVSISKPVRLSLTPPTPLVEMAPVSASSNTAQSKTSSSSSVVQPEVVATPLFLMRQAPLKSPTGVSRHRSSRSRQDSCASLSAASTVSVEDPSCSHCSRRASSACSSCTDTGVSGFPRPAFNRRVHFLLGDPAGGGLAAAEGLTASLRCSDEAGARLLLCPSTSSIAVPTPSDADQRPAFSANSSSNSKSVLSASSESLHGHLQLGPSFGGAATRPALSSLSLNRSSTPLVQSGGASVFSLHLHKKDGRIEATPSFAPAKSPGSSGMRATEVGGVCFHSAVSATTASATRIASSRSSTSGTHATATYQPGQPLPKPALKQVSRYSEGWSAADSRTGSKLVNEGSDRWSWWRSNAAAGAGTTASGSPGPLSLTSVVDRRFTSYLQGALISRQRHRVNAAEEASATAGRAAVAGGVAARSPTAPSSVRTPGSRGRRAELLVRLWLVKWSLVGMVVLAAFFFILIELVAD
ncbi:hypothetical protein LMJF_23_1290 [Leishmania major strain Friedlin]|uniref:Uncharacterized protein n=1 Tax=Leishmania major TaxID=5664 RepID=Q4QB23_LEIMA|nr:hypothetical protein LMJF_23_1290 [Leishmania major strain Friedlin]CAG9574376.1 hypothetical_protein_-_conserved [Leishmania major strain Friedlin]CAJ04863.1 hypothetical protein LMJF_23_1290 [Leishmania major strain Friedlin]|eukprot:XP_001683475.1 hypothetical protein LMJF_23_1290 [Leishmania major strain Friedlin]